MAKRSHRQVEQKSAREQPSRFKVTLEQATIAPWFLPLLGALGLLMGILLFDVNLSLSGDNAQFINLGRSLASGFGLSETLGDFPTPHTKYPFGFPLLLALVDILIPNSLIALKSLVVLLYAISVPLVYRFLRPYTSPSLALSVSILCLVSTPLLNFSHQVMSEIPFLPFSLLSLILVQRAHETGSRRTLLWAVLAIMAAYYVRSAGIVLVGTGVVFFALHQKWKEAGMVAAGSFLLALPWQLRNRALGGNDYIHQLLSVNPYQPAEGLLSIGGLIDRVFANAQIYGLRVIPEVFMPSALTEGPVLWGALFTALVVLGVLIGLRKRQLPALFLLLYMGLHLLWPQVWSDIRFLIPAIPILFYVFFTAVSELAARMGSRAAARAVAIAFLIALASNGAATRELRSQNGQLPPNWKNYFEAGEWIKNNTDPQTRIACRKPFLMNAITNRKSGGYIWESPDAIIADFEKTKVDIVIIDQIGFSSTPRYLVPAVEAHRDRFELLHIVRNPDTYVLRFRRPVPVGE
jgi:hypothetical protein